MKKILIIEDDKDILEILKIALEDTYQLKLFQNTINLIEGILEFSPDLILLDNQIGDGNAETIVANLRSEIINFNIPLILCSAHPDIIQKAQNIKAKDYIAKPFDLFDLLNSIEKNIN